MTASDDWEPVSQSVKAPLKNGTDTIKADGEYFH